MAFTEKTIKILTILIAISVLGAAAYYVYPLVIGEPEQPPHINISTSKFQGLLKKEDVCKLPGYEFTKAMVDAYKNPEDLSEDQKYDLPGGDHLYHSDEEISVKEILDFIVPVEGNKVIIAYYSPSYLTSDKTNGFNLYPKIGGTTEITDPNNFKIGPNQGFAILSCEDTKIWKVKNEKYSGADVLPSLIGNGILDNDWLLVPMVGGKNINDLLAENMQDAVQSVWLQKGPGFDFEEVELPNLNGGYDYYMAWFKVDKSLVTPSEAEEDVEVNVEEIIEDTMQDAANPPDPNDAGPNGADAQVETTGEAQIEKALEESIDGGQGPVLDMQETIFDDSNTVNDKDVTTNTNIPGQDITDMSGNDIGNDTRSDAKQPNEDNKDYTMPHDYGFQDNKGATNQNYEEEPDNKGSGNDSSPSGSKSNPIKFY